MSIHDLGNAPSQPIQAGDHRSILALLPEYVMLRVLGQPVPVEWQPLEQHLKTCGMCRNEADELERLMNESYGGQIPAMEAPAPDLAFLHVKRPTPPVAAPSVVTGLPRALGKGKYPLSFQVSAALLSQTRVPMAARSSEVRRRYHHEIRPANADDPTITIEVFSRDDDPGRALVRICVELPDRSPFEQAGSSVTLRSGAAEWSALTDQGGVAAFNDVPIEQLENWQITIFPCGANPGE